MPSKKLKEFLDSNGVKYNSIAHSTAYTAQEIAASAHIHGKELAKTVIVKLDGKMAMIVLAASYRIDFDLLKSVAEADKIELTVEQEFKHLFPDCNAGAMPPFGNLYGMKVYADASLALDEEIAFNAGTHSELIRIAYSDFERLAKPQVAKFTIRR